MEKKEINTAEGSNAVLCPAAQNVYKDMIPGRWYYSLGARVNDEVLMTSLVKAGLVDTKDNPTSFSTLAYRRLKKAKRV